MQNMDLKLVYQHLIAGRLPIGSNNAMKVVSNQAYALLGTNRLHVCIHEKSGYAYYFALESQYLNSSTSFTLPFTDVLPGKPKHQGDGIYMLRASDFTAVLVLEGGGARLVCNTPEVIDGFVQDLDLPIHEVAWEGGAPMRSVPQALLGVSERLGTWINKTSLGVIVLCCTVFVGLNVWQAIRSTLSQPKLNAQAVQNDLNDTLKKLSVQQPLAKQLSRIQQVSATVVRSGGWIERYSLKGDRNEEFEITLPSWVSQDYLDQLGRDVVTDLRDIEGLLIVRKSIKGK